jgi:ELWxxDGT repeat protein
VFFQGGSKIYRTDGTAAGTVQLESSQYIDDASPVFMMRAGNSAYFLANSIAGKTLWKTDGTVAGTVPVKLLSGTEWNSASFLGEFNGRIYLAVRDATGYARLWASDGTPEGTVKVSDVAVEVGGTPITAVMDNALYFFGGYGTPQMGIWKTDGTATGTVPLRAVPTQLYGMAASNGVLYMDVKGSAEGNPSGGWTLWASNGTPEGTFPLHEYLGAAEPLPFAGRAFFYATDATYGTELWSSDGTIAGTQVVADTWPGAHGATISPRAGVAGGMLLFSSEVPGMGSEPWRWVPDSNKPVANPGGPRSVPEGGTLRLTGSAGGLPGATITTYFWDLNYDGANFDNDVTGASPSSTFDASNLDGPSTRTIAMRALDSAGRLSDPSTATITVTNSAPVGLFANDGASVWFASVGDLAAADVAAGFRFSFDFDNDGVFEITDSASASAAIPAAYLATTGAHTVRGRVKDKDGGFTDYATTVTVAGPAWLAVGSNATWDAGTNTLTVTGATSITADPGPDAPVVRASGAAAVVTLDAATPDVVVHLGGLVLTGGASAVLNPGRRTAVVNGGANFSLDATSRFDLSDGTLIVKGGSLPTVQALVTAGFHGGWQGVGGIESSAAASDSTGRTALGCVGNEERGLTSFGGASGLTPGDVLVRYTYSGDADLDGDVDGNDVGRWATNFTGSGGSTSKTWLEGDWDYDGDVDGNDAGRWAMNFTGSGGGA